VLFGNFKPPEPPEPETTPADKVIVLPPGLPEAPAIDEALTEILRDKVLQWRCKVFLDLGMNLHQARRLTLQRDADLAEARSLHSQGCPTDLIFDILAA
jgi:hypothetical protein